MVKEDLKRFLDSVFKKINDVENMMLQSPPKHIIAYRKILGIQQKLELLPLEEKQNLFFVEIIQIRGAIFYFTNGRYEDGMASIDGIKQRLIDLWKKNERD